MRIHMLPIIDNKRKYLDFIIAKREPFNDHEFLRFLLLPRNFHVYKMDICRQQLCIFQHQIHLLCYIRVCLHSELYATLKTWHLPASTSGLVKFILTWIYIPIYVNIQCINTGGTFISGIIIHIHSRKIIKDKFIYVLVPNMLFYVNKTIFNEN